MKSNIYILLFTALTLTINSCDQSDDDINPIVSGCTDNSANNYNPLATQDDGSCIIMGCTNTDAENYNPNATDDDGSCIILGCMDPIAINYNPEATISDNLCEYSNASILNGTWDIISLQYETEIDIQLFQQDLSGEAYDAGTWSFNSENYSVMDAIYSMNLDFETEPFTISIPLVGDYDVPSFPVENSSNGNWVLTDNDNTLLTTDTNTGVESSYQIISLTNENAYISGTIPFSQEVAGMAIDLEIDVTMFLEKQ